MNVENIKERVRLVKLSNPNMSAYEILKNQNFVFGYIPTELHYRLPEGCYFKLSPFRFVLIHPELDMHTKNIVYAHELGHSIEHPDVNTMELEQCDPVFVDKIENEADFFAAEFLLEDDVFLKYPTLSNEEIAKKKHVNLKHVELKLKYLDKEYLPEKHIDDYEYTSNFKCVHDYDYLHDCEYSLDNSIYI
ncbi:MAG: ImmA/IrrE family metallo-endopeptidase [Paraclostridium sp.]